MVWVAVAWILLAGALVYARLPLRDGPLKDRKLLDMCLTEQDLRATLARFRSEPGACGAHLRYTRSTDTVFPAAYCIAFSVGIGAGFPGAPGLVIIPLITVLADYLENTISIRMLETGDGQFGRHIVATWVKFIGFGLSFLALAGATLKGALGA